MGQHFGKTTTAAVASINNSNNSIRKNKTTTKNKGTLTTTRLTAETKDSSALLAPEIVVTAELEVDIGQQAGAELYNFENCNSNESIAPSISDTNNSFQQNQLIIKIQLTKMAENINDASDSSTTISDGSSSSSSSSIKNSNNQKIEHNANNDVLLRTSIVSLNLNNGDIVTGPESPMPSENETNRIAGNSLLKFTDFITKEKRDREIIDNYKKRKNKVIDPDLDEMISRFQTNSTQQISNSGRLQNIQEKPNASQDCNSTKNIRPRRSDGYSTSAAAKYAYENLPEEAKSGNSGEGRKLSRAKTKNGNVSSPSIRSSSSSTTPTKQRDGFFRRLLETTAASISSSTTSTSSAVKSSSSSPLSKKSESQAQRSTVMHRSRKSNKSQHCNNSSNNSRITSNSRHTSALSHVNSSSSRATPEKNNRGDDQSNNISPIRTVSNTFTSGASGTSNIVNITNSATSNLTSNSNVVVSSNSNSISIATVSATADSSNPNNVIWTTSNREDLIIPITTPQVVVVQCPSTSVVTLGRHLTASDFARMGFNGTGNRESQTTDSSLTHNYNNSNSNKSSSNTTNSNTGPIVHSQVDFVHYLVPDLDKIINCSYYWGKMDRYEAEHLLEGKAEGTFLLRDSAQEEFLFSVTFRKYGRSLHARIEQMGHMFSFDCHDPSVFTAPTVTSLIQHYKDPTCVMFFEPMLTIPLHRKNPFTLQELSRAAIVANTTYDGINQLELPIQLKSYLKKYHYKQRLRVKPLDEPFYGFHS